MHEQTMKYLLVTPLLIFVLFLIAFPAVYDIYLSVHDTSLENLQGTAKFIGLSNFVSTLKDPTFRHSLLFSLKFASVVTLIEVFVGLMLALYFYHFFKRHDWVMTFILIPMIFRTLIQFILNKGEIKEQKGQKVLNLIYVGKVQPKIRGLEQQLIVLKVLNHMGIHSKLIIYGEGKIKELMLLAEKYGVKKYVEYRGVVHYEKLLNTLKREGGVIILPPLGYLLPSKFFEALVIGIIPIIPKNNKDMIAILGSYSLIYDPHQALRDILKILYKLYTRNAFLKCSQHITSRASRIITTLLKIVYNNIREIIRTIGDN